MYLSQFALLLVRESFVVGFESEVAFGVYSDDYWQMIRRESCLSFPSSHVARLDEMDVMSGEVACCVACGGTRVWVSLLNTT